MERELQYLFVVTTLYGIMGYELVVVFNLGSLDKDGNSIW